MKSPFASPPPCKRPSNFGRPHPAKPAQMQVVRMPRENTRGICPRIDPMGVARADQCDSGENEKVKALMKDIMRSRVMG